MAYTKWAWHTPNGRGIYQVGVAYTKWAWHTPLGRGMHPVKLYQMGRATTTRVKMPGIDVNINLNACFNIFKVMVDLLIIFFINPINTGVFNMIGVIIFGAHYTTDLFEDDWEDIDFDDLYYHGSFIGASLTAIAHILNSVITLTVMLCCYKPQGSNTNVTSAVEMSTVANTGRVLPYTCISIN